jgi:hypothetical protein
MRHLLAAILCALAAQAVAEEMPVVVELYTSQGCSSCPPADALLKQLAGMDGVIPLSLHVDYWDYIGWPDGFAKADHTARQEAYARAAGERMVYTPQMIFNGADAVVGGDAGAVMGRLQAHSGATTPIALSLSRQDGTLAIRARSDADLPRLVVQVVRFRPAATVAIEAGENAGHTLDYANVVTDWQVVGRWSGAGDLSLAVPLPGPEPVVVILQEEGPGPIRAAKLLR